MEPAVDHAPEPPPRRRRVACADPEPPASHVADAPPLEFRWRLPTDPPPA